MKRITFLSIMLLFIVSVPLKAQWSINAVSTAHQITFDLTVNGVINTVFATTASSPMFATPPDSGMLDAGAWTYIKDGAYDTTAAVFPGTGNADFTTLTAPGASSYGWGAWDLSGNHAIGVLPSGANATSGSLSLMVVNNTGQTIESLDISYYVAAYNDQTRANKVDFLYSLDNLTWVKNPGISFVSGAAATTAWESDTKTLNIPGLNIADGSTFYLRWFFADASGSGSRDEFLLDDITITATGGSPTTASQLDIISVNNGVSPSVGTPFNVVVQSKNSTGQIANVDVDKLVTLSIQSGSGNLGGTLTGTILAGTNSVTISGVVYDQPDTEVELLASTTSLNAGDSDPFDVLDKASQLIFTAVPIQGTANALIGNITVEARRADNSLDVNFTGNITLLPYSGTFTIGGTTVKSAQGGIATFSDIFFQYPGTYQILAMSYQLTADTTDPIVIVQGPEMTEIIVPQYIGSKSASSANNCRTPYSVCLEFHYLLPNTAYDVRIATALVTEANSSYGAGNYWNGTQFSGTSGLPNYFVSDAEGNSGLVWFILQPTGNGSRFDAGMVHNLRVGIIPNGGVLPSSPSFIGTKTITALDIPVTERTLSTADDGAFVRGNVDPVYTGNYFMLYDNVDGNGNPIYCYQVRQTLATQSANTELPPSVDSIWQQLSGTEVGDWAAVVPVGANNPNGIRRVEIRDNQNQLLTSFTDDDGIWPEGGNTLTTIRRDVVELVTAAAPSTITINGNITYANDASTPMDSCIVYLIDSLGNQITTNCDSNGYYSFTIANPGNYTVTASCDKKWGGANAVDALLILRHFVGSIQLTGILKQGADPNGDGYINAVDALSVQKRFVQLISTFNAGNWQFESVEVNAPAFGTYTADFKAVCTGDVNGSYIPMK